MFTRGLLVLACVPATASCAEPDVPASRRAGRRVHGPVAVGNGGHYVYGTGSRCADEATGAFLTRGTLPARDMSCPRP